MKLSPCADWPESWRSRFSSGASGNMQHLASIHERQESIGRFRPASLPELFLEAGIEDGGGDQGDRPLPRPASCTVVACLRSHPDIVTRELFGLSGRIDLNS
jgi:hypothetical protein